LLRSEVAEEEVGHEGFLLRDGAIDFAGGDGNFLAVGFFQDNFGVGAADE